MKDKIIMTFIILWLLFMVFTMIMGIIVIGKAVKKTYIIIRCKLSPTYNKRYTDEQIHKAIKRNLEIYYSNKKKSRYKKYMDQNAIYMQEIWDQYEDWRNPKP